MVVIDNNKNEPPSSSTQQQNDDHHRLAIVSGPAVVLWDCLATAAEAASSKATTTISSGDETNDENNNDDGNGDDDDDDNCDDLVTSYPHGQNFNLSVVAFNHNASVLASATSSSDRERPQDHDSIDLMTTSDCTSFRTVQHDRDRTAGKITTLCFGEGSRFLCCGDDRGDISIWDIKHKRRIRQHVHPGQRPSPSLQVECVDGGFGSSTNFSLLLSMTAEYIFVYDPKTSKRLGKLVPNHPSGQFTRFHISAADTSIVCAGTMGGEILFYDVSAFQTTTTDTVTGSSSVSTASHNNCGRKSTTSSSSSSYSYSSSSSLKPYKVFPVQHDGPVTGLAMFRTDMNILVSSGAEGNACVWNVSTATLLQAVCTLENDTIRSICLHDDDKLLAVGTESGHVRVFEVSSASSPGRRKSRLVSQLEFGGPVEQVLFAPTHRSKKTSPTSSSTVSSIAVQENVHQRSNTNIDKTNIGKGSIFKPSNKNKMLLPSKSTALTEEKVNLESHDERDSDHIGIPAICSTDSSMMIPQPYLGPSSSSSSSPESKARTMKQKQQQQQHQLLQPEQRQHQKHSTIADTTASPRQPEKHQSSPQPHVPQHTIHQKSTGVTHDEVQDIVQNEVERLGDSLEERLRDLQLIMISQFHQQSEDMKRILSDQMTTIASLKEENQLLREENERLRQGYR